MYPGKDGLAYHERFGHFDTEEDKPVFPEEVVPAGTIPDLRSAESVRPDEYPRADVSYNKPKKEPEIPRYYRCVRTTTGKSYLVRGTLAGMDHSVKFLLDTGANMNIIPMDIFARIPDAKRPKLEPSKYNIEVGGRT